jgi:hypothetical protein
MNIDYRKQPPYFKVSDTHYAATWLLDPHAPKVEMPKIVSERIRLSLENAKKLGDVSNQVENQGSEEDEFTNPDLYKKRNKPEMIIIEKQTT